MPGPLDTSPRTPAGRTAAVDTPAGRRAAVDGPAPAVGGTRTGADPAGHLDPGAPREPEEAFDEFIRWATDRGLTPYPHQQEALLELMVGSNVILATPTGSGKSLVATGAAYLALTSGRRTVYTAPIKALVSEKFFDLVEIFGAERVGMLTGDATVNPGAPIIAATAEVLATLALRAGPDAGVDLVVADEFHFYADPDRGWAWQVPLLELPRAQFLLMSATLGDMSTLAADLRARTGRPTAVVTSASRPVPLSYRYVTTPVHETIETLLAEGEAPIYVVHFTQAAAVERAQALTSLPLADRARKDAIAEAIAGFRFTTGFGTTLSRLVRAGIGVHHAGMLPRYRRLVERLAQAGLLTVICGTDTLGVGINVPIRTVLLTSLTKYDGRRTRVLKAREFHQIAGRAGRPGYDTHGTVVVQAPEHVVENARALAKAGDDPRKRRKVVRRKPADGTVSWTEQTFQRLVAAEPERLTSQFRVTHAMVLAVLSRPGDAFTAMRHLLESNHDDRKRQLAHIRRAIDVYRALRTAGVVEQLDAPDPAGRTIRLTVDLQPDFALDQPLSPFALAALTLLDRTSPDYALDAVSVIEATLEDPMPLLLAQQRRARDAAIAAMKADGLEYDERMARLEEVTWPRPLAELLEHAYETYRAGHPWVGDYEIAPKSVVRDMWERAMTFSELIAHYGLARSEGLVLRYLADAYKALRRTVPEEAKTDELREITDWLGAMVRQTDSSLLDEWERLLDPGTAAAAAGRAERGAAGGVRVADDTPPPVTSDERAFRAMVRNALFRRVELAALRRYDALGELDAQAGWDADAWSHALAGYWARHDGIGTGPDARGPHMLLEEREPGRWRVRQILDDPAGEHDWGISAEVDLAASDAAGEPALRVTGVDQL